MAMNPESNAQPLQYELSADRRTVNLRPYGGALGVSELEHLIAELGRVRASMLPSVRESLTEGAGSTQYMDCLTAWGMAPEQPLPTEHGALFMGCSSAYGWFHFPATPEFCRQLAKWLTTDGTKHGVLEERRAAH